MQFGVQSISSHPKSFSPISFSCYRGKPTDHWQLDKTNIKTYIEYFLVGFWWCSLSQLFNSNRNFNLLPFWDPKSLPKRSMKGYSVSHLCVNSPNYLYILQLLSRLKYSEQWEDMADNKNTQKTCLVGVKKILLVEWVSFSHLYCIFLKNHIDYLPCINSPRDA